MLQRRLFASPRLLAAAIALDRAPAALWLALLAAALGPTWWWMGRRMVDGSDEPLGPLAVLALAVLAWCLRHRLRAAPRLQWLVAAVAGALLAAALQGAWPPLLTGLLALLALGAGLVAFLPAGIATAPVLGLSVLALPLLASLQFYAGYPLRVLTAEASRWLLAPWFTTSRSGSALLVDGRLVIVDAPCSGVQMLWLAYFTACVVALHAGRDDRAFLTRLPLVSALVLAGNVLRNSVLVAAEASGHALPAAGHEAVGLAVLALVVLGVARVMGHGGRDA